MRARLRIGEVADLLGVTPKAIRHYHKRGLLAEPERSEGGYRLYGARDLVRLLRIRRLQALGLSLAQIQRVLGAPDQERSLRGVLEALLAACSAQIQTLEARRDRIRSLLAEPALDALDRPPDTPALLRWAREQLGDRLPAASPAVREQDAQIFGLLEAFAWPEGQRRQMQAAAQGFAEHPERYPAMVEIAEQLAALASVPEDAPEVERLVEDATRSGLAQLCLREPPVVTGAAGDPHGAVIADLMLSALAPAQRRFLALVRERLSGSDPGKVRA